MTTVLTDLVYGEEYAQYTAERAIELNAFIASGIAQVNALLNQLAAGQGGIYTLPFFKQLGTDEPNVSTDNPATIASTKKITTGAERARLSYYNQVWASADLAAALIARDPLAAIGDATAQYWATVSQRIMIQSALGVYADNVANDSGDMVVNISTITDANGGAAARALQDSTVIDAAQTMGDHKTSVVAEAMHSAVHARLQKIGALQDHHDSETGRLLFQTHLGKRVIVDDSMPISVVSINDGGGASNKNVYTTILFGEGAFQLGFGAPKVPTETQRSAKGGNGGGIEELIERKHLITHPAGFAWTEDSVASESPTYAELATAANWNRVKQRKNIPLAFIRSRLD